MITLTKVKIHMEFWKCPGIGQSSNKFITPVTTPSSMYNSDKFDVIMSNLVISNSIKKAKKNPGSLYL